ncbi:PREDICTED: Retrovirus-related Pol poly from transposon, partial [Prunus dulcis]
LRGFLGLTCYYRKFIPHYGRESFPLTQLTKKDGFLWTPEATAAFHKLKELMLSPRVLALPDFTKPFIIESDASGSGIGAVLQQEGRPIAFTSKTLGPRNQALSTYEREMMAIVHAIKKWHHYLQGRHFIIKTDHHSLKYFLNHKAHTPFQQKWVTKLLGYDYEIHYRQGSDNKAADALSRFPI